MLSVDNHSTREVFAASVELSLDLYKIHMSTSESEALSGVLGAFESASQVIDLFVVCNL